MEWHQNAHYVEIPQSAFRHATGNSHIKLLDSGKDKVDGIKGTRNAAANIIYMRDS
jgi:hypothetical protein